MKCLNCNKETGNPKFCSRSCSATYNNRISPKRRKRLKFCLNCKKELNYQQYKYCSFRCQQENHKSIVINNWLSGKISGTICSNKHIISSTIRNYLLENAGYKCSKCGWGELNPFTKTTHLHIHHLDGDFKNSKPENLQVLCPNCHSLTESYGIINKGNGRRIYYKDKGIEF